MTNDVARIQKSKRMDRLFGVLTAVGSCVVDRLSAAIRKDAAAKPQFVATASDSDLFPFLFLMAVLHH